jgi:hypothetical protein
MGVFTTAAKTWGAEALKSSDLNAQVRDLINGFGAWNTSASTPAYTPTVTGITLGSGTVTGAYSQVGKVVNFRVTVTLGTGFSVAGNPIVSLPVAAISTSRDFNITAKFATSGGSVYQAGAIPGSTTTVNTYILGTNGAFTTVTSTTPFTWGIGYLIYVGGTYEAA